MKRILLADRQPVTRHGLRQWLADLGQSVEVSETNDVKEMFNILGRQPHDAVVLDLDVGQPERIDMIKRIRRQYAHVAILVFTPHPEHIYGLRALQAGALGFVGKLSSKESVLLAVQRTLEGQHFISRKLSDQLAQQVSGRQRAAGHESLSNREHQIVSMIAGGLTASQIGIELSLSVKTVHTHRARALKKLGLRNNSEVTHYAFRNGLLEFE